MSNPCGRIERVHLQCLELKLSKVNEDLICAARRHKLSTLLVETRSVMKHLMKAHLQKCCQVAQLVKSGLVDEAIRSIKLIFDQPSKSEILHILFGACTEMLRTWCTHLGIPQQLELRCPALDMIFIYNHLYMLVLHMGHADQPQILLLRYFMDEARQQMSGSHLDFPFRHIVIDCKRILARISQGIRIKDYSLCRNLVETLSRADKLSWSCCTFTWTPPSRTLCC